MATRKPLEPSQKINTTPPRTRKRKISCSPISKANNSRRTQKQDLTEEEKRRRAKLVAMWRKERGIAGLDKRRNKDGHKRKLNVDNLSGMRMRKIKQTDNIKGLSSELKASNFNDKLVRLQDTKPSDSIATLKECKVYGIYYQLCGLVCF